jgi:SAM-dependent methyltransferase
MTAAVASDLAIDLARYYDLDMLDVAEDVGMYLELANETGGPVLELAAGSGRVAVPLARAGHRVVALDNDPEMLQRAREAWAAVPADDRKGGELEVIDGDLTVHRDDERYGLVILALNSIMLLDDEAARAAALVTMRAHLRPGGIAVVDVVTPDQDELETYDGRLQLEWVRHDGARGELVSKLMSARLDPDAATVELNQLFDASPAHGGPVRRTVRRDTLHLLSAADLRRLAERAGLDGTDLRGDHHLTGHGPGSPRAILIGRLV